MGYDHFKYQAEYHKKHYTQITIKISKELASLFEQKLKENKDKKTTVLKKMIEEYTSK